MIQSQNWLERGKMAIASGTKSVLLSLFRIVSAKKLFWQLDHAWKPLLLTYRNTCP